MQYRFKAPISLPTKHCRSKQCGIQANTVPPTEEGHQLWQALLQPGNKAFQFLVQHLGCLTLHLKNKNDKSNPSFPHTDAAHQLRPSKAALPSKGIWRGQIYLRWEASSAPSNSTEVEITIGRTVWRLEVVWAAYPSGSKRKVGNTMVKSSVCEQFIEGR